MTNKLRGSYTFILILTFIFFSGVGIAQQNYLRVAVFKYDLVDSISFPKTTIDVQSYLNTTLGAYDQIEIVPIENTRLGAPQKDSLLLGLQLTGAYDIDMVVFGSYVVENRYVNIQPFIFDVNTSRFYSQSVSRGIIDEVGVVIDRVSTNITDKFIEISPVMRKSFNRVVILSDFKQVPGSSRKVIGQINKLSEKYTKQVIDFLDYDGVDYAEIIPFSQILKYDESRKMIVDSINPDIIITLNYKFDSLTPVSLETEFLVYEKNSEDLMVFNLPELKSDHYPGGKIDFQDFIQNEIFHFINHTIDNNGKLKRSSFIQLKSVGPSDKSYIKKAESLAKNGDFYLSNVCYYNAINNEDESVKTSEIHLKLGFNKVYMYRLDEADAEFVSVLDADENIGLAYVGKSLISYYSADYGSSLAYYEDAIAMLQKAKEKGLNNDLVFDALMGYYNFEIKNYAVAQIHFERAAKANRNVPKIRIRNEQLPIESLQIHVGLCYIGQEQYNEAIIFFQKLKREFPVNKDIPYYLGHAYSSRGMEKFYREEYAEALPDLEASKKNYSDPDINEYIRTSMINLGQFEQANHFIEQEIETQSYDASFIWKKHALDIRNLMLKEAASSGVYDEKLGAEVIRTLERSLLAYENDPIAMSRLGEIYILLGDNPLGLEYSQKAKDADPFDFEVRLGLLQALVINGAYQACVSEYKDISTKRNRKLFDTRTNVLLEFFFASALLAENKKAKKELNKINKELETDVVISRWIFEPYEKWLNNCPCSSESSESLKILLASLKATRSS